MILPPQFHARNHPLVSIPRATPLRSHERACECEPPYLKRFVMAEMAQPATVTAIDLWR